MRAFSSERFKAASRPGAVCADVNAADVHTWGPHADGVYARSLAVAASVTTTGTVTTEGTTSTGIFARADNGPVVVQSNYVTTGRAHSVGLYARSAVRTASL